MSMDRILAEKYGMTEDQARAANQKMTSLAATVGLEYHLDRVRPGNTFDAHRLLHLAAARGVGADMKERLLAAYFTEGQPVGDRATLVGTGHRGRARPGRGGHDAGRRRVRRRGAG